MRPVHSLYVPLLVVLLHATTATAQERGAVACFAAFRDGDTARPRSRSEANPVTFSTRFTVSDRCQYSLRGGMGPFHPLAGVSDADFATLVSRLWNDTPETERPPGGRPLAVYACAGTECTEHTRATAHPQSIFLESCAAHLLGAAQSIVRLRVNTESHRLEVGATASAACGGNGTVLHIAPISAGAPPAFCEGAACGTDRLSLAEDRTLSIAADHDWAVFAGRADGAAGMYVGHLRPGNPDSALRRFMDGNAHDWLAGDFSAGRLRLVRGTALASHDEAWDELRVAVQAQQAWLARTVDHGDPQPLGALGIDPSGDAITLPDAPVRDFLASRYGARAARAMVPTARDWRDLSATLSACVISRYTRDAVDAHAPPPHARCVHLRDVMPPLQLAGRPPQLCITRTVRQLTRTGTRGGEAAAERCSDPGDAARAIVATVGDTLAVRDLPAGTHLAACVDNDCAPAGDLRAIVLRRAGLVELRAAGADGDATRAQGLAIGRVIVIDPATQWHPVGLYTATTARSDHPWRTLTADDDETFVFVRRARAMSFLFTSSTPVAAAINSADGTTDPARLTQDVPVLAATDVPAASPGPSALVAFVSRERACPSDLPPAVRRRALVDPHGFVLDERFHVFLLHYVDETHPYECLARASLRVLPATTFTPVTGIGWLQLRALGDPHLMFWYPSPAGVGLALPLAQAYLRLPQPADWFHWGVDGSFMATAGLGFNDGGSNRTGLAVTLGLALGVWRLPRLLQLVVGVHMLAISTEAHPLVAGYVGINLGSLYDLLRGN